MANGTAAERGEVVGQLTAAVAEAVVGTKGAGAAVKATTSATKLALGAEKTAQLSAAISKLQALAKLNHLTAKAKGVFKVGRKAVTKELTAPKGWVIQASKKGGGTVFKDPSNPHNIIRQMPGNPNSPNLLQQNPYVKFMKEGKFYDGNVLPNGSVPGAHIPLDQFNINNMPKF